MLAHAPIDEVGKVVNLCGYFSQLIINPCDSSARSLASCQPRTQFLSGYPFSIHYQSVQNVKGSVTQKPS